MWKFTPKSYKRFRAQRGFGLLELIVGIAIIAILGSAVAVHLTGTTQAAQAASKLDQAHTLNFALAAYQAAGGTAPQDADVSTVLDLLESSDNVGNLGQRGPWIVGPPQLSIDGSYLTYTNGRFAYGPSTTDIGDPSSWLALINSGTATTTQLQKLAQQAGQMDAPTLAAFEGLSLPSSVSQTLSTTLNGLATSASHSQYTDAPTALAQLLQLASSPNNPGNLDLANLDLSQTPLATLAGINWAGQNLENTNLSGIDFSDNGITPNFSNADLTGANFGGDNLTGSNFGGANLSGSSFLGSNLTGANLANSNLTNAGLQYTTLNGTSLSYADLQGVNWYEATINYSDFSNAKMAGTDMGFGSFTGDNFSNADMENSQMPFSLFVDDNFSNADLSSQDTNTYSQDSSQANLSWSVWSGDNLTDANLSNTIMNTAIMYDSDFADANMTGADESYTYWKNDNLNNSNFSDILTNATTYTADSMSSINWTDANINGTSFVGQPTDMGFTNYMPAGQAELAAEALGVTWNTTTQDATFGNTETDTSDTGIIGSDLNVANSQMGGDNFSGMNFQGFNAAGMDLNYDTFADLSNETGTNFTGATSLVGTTFDNVDLSNFSYQYTDTNGNTVVPDLDLATIENSNLTNSNLEGFGLGNLETGGQIVYEPVLTNDNLAGSDLSYSDFTGPISNSNLNDTNLTNATIDGYNFSNDSFLGAVTKGTNINDFYGDGSSVGIASNYFTTAQLNAAGGLANDVVAGDQTGFDPTGSFTWLYLINTTGITGASFNNATSGNYVVISPGQIDATGMNITYAFTNTDFNQFSNFDPSMVANATDLSGDNFP